MNTRKIFGCGAHYLLCAFAVMFALAFTALSLTGCPSEPDLDTGTGNGPDTIGGGGTGHTHTYATEWSFNATQHWHECTAGDGAKSAVASHTGDPCNACGYSSTATSVTFSTVTADGGASATTTALTLTFSAAIAGLSASDINLSGVTGVTKGTLSGAGPTYTLPISGFTAGGTLSVAVAKTGYNISGSPKSTAIYYYTSSGGGGGGPTTWTAVSNSTFSDYTINGIAYGGGKWVAVSSKTPVGNKIAYSDDGETWTDVSDSKFGVSAIYAIAYGNGMFVAGGDTGTMATSTDGATWTAVTYTSSTFWRYFDTSSSTGKTASIYAIAYGNGKFVAVGSGGQMAYSTDGATWTAITGMNSPFGTDISIYGIAYGGGTFVAVGTSGKMATSSDGVTWTAISGANSTFSVTQINAIAYGSAGNAGGKFVAVGNYGRMATSTNGASWTSVSSTNSTFGSASNQSNIYGIAYGNGMFVAGGEYGKMAYSTDGATWTAVSVSTFPNNYSGDINAIVYGNNKFVAVGSGGKMAYADWPEDD